MPIHYAARAGRSKNIDVLMKHAKSIGKFFSSPSSLAYIYSTCVCLSVDQVLMGSKLHCCGILKY